MRRRLYLRLAANAAYAALNAAGGVMLRSLRMGALAFYYLLLTALRLYLLHGYRHPVAAHGCAGRNTAAAQR